MNEYFANLADEMKKCLEFPVEHFEVETDENTIYMLPTDQPEKFKLLDFCSKSKVKV